MKKIQYYILIFALLFAMLGGVNFDTASSVVSPTLDEAISVEPPTSVPGDKEEEITEYTYKDFGYYYKDKDFSNITLTGTGTETDPYQVNSTEDFLHMFSGISVDEYVDYLNTNLPDAYTEVAYLSSTGTQYIDTGVTLNQNIRPSISFTTNVGRVSSSNYVFGAIDQTNNIGSFLYKTGWEFYASHGVNDSALKLSRPSSGIASNYEYREDNRWYLNDNLIYKVPEVESTGNSTITMCLFGRKSEDGTVGCFSAGNLNIREFKFHDGNELIHHYIPCYRNEDTKPGMYDIITGDFLTNAGTGEFEYGFYDENIYTSLNNKYIDINCDIILNEETFDKEGNARGGDGIVYQWHPISTGNTGTFINGNGYTIKGLYYKGNKHSVAALFSSKHLNFENLNMEDIYINNLAGTAGAFASSLKNAKNCSTHGHIIAKSYAGGFFPGYVGIPAFKFENCKNYAYVSAGTYAGGIVAYAHGGPEDYEFINCKNYGDIMPYAETGSGNCGGIAAHIAKPGAKVGHLVFKDCINYGTIRSNTGSAAGIQASGYGQDFINCANYGELIHYSKYALGGIAAIEARLFYKCKNYGKLTIDSSVSSSNQHHELGLKITNLVECYVKSASGKTVVFSATNVENCKFEFLRTPTWVFWSAGKLDNVEITYNNFNASKFPTLSLSPSALILKNVKINVRGAEGQAKIPTPTKYALGQNLIYECTLASGEKQNFYQGSSFSGFYTSWKTGKIGLIRMDGRGSFQGEVNEDVLAKKGYTKIT